MRGTPLLHADDGPARLPSDVQTLVSDLSVYTQKSAILTPSAMQNPVSPVSRMDRFASTDDWIATYLAMHHGCPLVRLRVLCTSPKDVTSAVPEKDPSSYALSSNVLCVTYARTIFLEE